MTKKYLEGTCGTMSWLGILTFFLINGTDHTTLVTQVEPQIVHLRDADQAEKENKRSELYHARPTPAASALAPHFSLSLSHTHTHTLQATSPHVPGATGASPHMTAAGAVSSFQARKRHER